MNHKNLARLSLSQHPIPERFVLFGSFYSPARGGSQYFFSFKVYGFLALGPEIWMEMMSYLYFDSSCDIFRQAAVHRSTSHPFILEHVEYAKEYIALQTDLKYPFFTHNLPRRSISFFIRCPIGISLNGFLTF